MSVTIKIYPDKNGFNVEAMNQSELKDTVSEALDCCDHNEHVKVSVSIVKNEW